MTKFSGSGDDGGSIWWLLTKVVVVIIGAFVLFSFLMSIFKYIVAAAVLGALGYAGYRFLAGPTKSLPEKRSPLLLEGKDEEPMRKRLRALEEEDRRLSEEIERLSKE